MVVTRCVTEAFDACGNIKVSFPFLTLIPTVILPSLFAIRQSRSGSTKRKGGEIKGISVLSIIAPGRNDNQFAS